MDLVDSRLSVYQVLPLAECKREDFWICCPYVSSAVRIHIRSIFAVSFAVSAYFGTIRFV